MIANSSAPKQEDRPLPRATVVLVTGMSGAGKSSTLKALEDLGYEAVDNLPLSLLRTLVLTEQPAFADGGFARPLAIGVDIRTRDFDAADFLAKFDQLQGKADLAVSLVFLECDDEVLGNRFAETRRRHPLAQDRPVRDGLRHERQLLLPIKQRATVVLDTTNKRLPDLKRALATLFGSATRPALSVFVTSFSYARGLPREADLVFDVRFLDNPHYVGKLRPLTGRDSAVGEYIEKDSGFRQFFGTLTGLLTPLLPRYAAEGKSYLTIAIGCTGGRHRSVFVAERLGAWLQGKGENVHVQHRDLDVAAG
ncbi:MAG: RNase adapter RapZ [Rhodospirillales bacterium]|nr:RNase adapter RapZ [Rhodospirillales bacterium]